MGHEHDSASQSATTAMLILVLVGLILLGGGGVVSLFWVSMERRAQAQAAMQRERAIAEMRRAESLARQVQATSQAEQQLTTQGTNQALGIELNARGEILVEGQIISLAQLEELLQTSKPEVIDLNVDGHCDFIHVAEVKARCHAAGISKVHIKGFED